MAKKSSDQVYHIITDRIIQLLEAGTVPWHKPWSLRVDGKHLLPRNLVSDIAYRGINIFSLTMAGFANPYWVTFRQAQALGGSVRAGERGFPVIFFKMLDREQSEGEGRATNKIPILRYYTVFNTDQCDGITTPAVHTIPSNIFDAIAECDHLVEGMPNRPDIRSGRPQAFYHPALDFINMPQKELFASSEEYYSTLFHELVHSTGHSKRLDRSTLTDLGTFGDANYSKEELVAEMGATFLCGIAGIENKTIINSAAYLAHWIKKLKQEPRLLIQAGTAAQKAVDYILGAKAPDSQVLDQEAVPLG